MIFGINVNGNNIKERGINMDKYVQIIKNRYPDFRGIYIEQELDNLARSTVFLTVDVPPNVLAKLNSLSNGRTRHMATSFNINGNTITFKSDALINMYPLLDTITR